MSFVNLLIGAAALYGTDIILAPMIAGNEMMRWAKLLLQAYVLNILYQNSTVFSLSDK
jgi:hypothetical protein